MITKLVFLTSTLLAGCVLGAFAQEEQYPSQTEEIPETRVEENNPRESGMQIWEMERIQREVRTQTESAPVRKPADAVVEPRDKQKNIKEKGSQPAADESVLSFNFLYYLIQKFKLSESVD